MSKEHFQLDRCTPLDAVSNGKRVHLIGICGIAMAQLAAFLKKKGFNVTGSDKEFYYPALSILKEAEINNLSSFKKENITKDISLAVIGNSQSYTNCEIQEIERLNIPYTCFPKLLYELIIKKRRSVVISGTHGKTTTTALTAWCFKTAGFVPSYFIGGKVIQLNSSLFQGEKYSVVEGDEYDSSFFAKIPKFAFYSPDILIITNIDFDHADIYRSLEEIEEQFSRLVSSVPNNGFIIACIDNPVVRKNLASWQKKTKASIITYGKSELADYRLLLRETENSQEKVEILTPSGKDAYLLGITGEHNALNSTAVYSLFKEEGLPISALKRGLKTFKGVKRRQEIVYKNHTVLIDDFAHHPTEVLATLKSIRDQYPKKRVIAVFEPRSNTSRRDIFLNQYAEAFLNADVVFLREVKQREIDKEVKLLETHLLANKLNKRGVCAKVGKDGKELAEMIAQDAKKDDVIIVMSNGSFDGIIRNLTVKLKNSSL